MKDFYEMLEYCQNELDCNGHDLGIKFNKYCKTFLKLYREDRKLFYKENPKVNLDGIDMHNLIDEQSFCIYSYTSSCSNWINGDIRNKKKLSICKELYAQYLDKSLDKIPSHNERHIFRMDTPDEYQIQKWKKTKVGEIIHIPYFLSSSKENWDVESTDRSWIVWKIKILASNSKARDISNLTNLDEEQEILFKRNSYFKVETVNIGQKVIELIEVEQSPNAIII